MNDSKPPDDLNNKVSEWLSNEGYPLEFSTASAFHKNGFDVKQGYYVQDKHHDIPREIDVLAQVSSDLGQSLLRLCYVIECKWSGDKPWVVFTSPQHRIATSACIAQTIGSEAGETILWSLAGDDTLQSLDTFNTPRGAGLNGRQAFSKGNDVFYNSMQSVATAANSLAAQYNRDNKTFEDILNLTVVIFPVIVVEGVLFQAKFNEGSGHIELERSDYIRIHWRGAEAAKFPFTTIDLVNANRLNDFAQKRKDEATVVLSQMKKTLKQLQECVKTKSIEPFEILKGPRGVVGLPPLLSRIKNLGKVKSASDINKNPPPSLK